MNMANIPPSSKKRRFTSDIIKVVVGTGDNNDEFHVHEDYLRKHSAFLQTALNKNWKEGQERKIELPEDGPDMFAAYVEWLYHNKMPVVPQEITGDRAQDAYFHFRFFAKLYVFGEKIQDDLFCDLIATSMVGYTKEHVAYPGITAVKIIYEGTPEGSPARLLVTHLYATHAAAAGTYRETIKRNLLGCSDFLADLAMYHIPVSRYDTELAADVCVVRKEWLKVIK